MVDHSTGVNTCSSGHSSIPSLLLLALASRFSLHGVPYFEEAYMYTVVTLRGETPVAESNRLLFYSSTRRLTLQI